MKPIRVLLADDHSLVRAGIGALLRKIPDVQIVAEAENGNEAMQLLEKFLPDLALLDIEMPELGGLEALARISKEYPQVRVVILSMHAEEEYVMEALRLGAKGYLLKGSRIPELELAITSVMEGETYLSPQAAKHVVEHKTDTPSPMRRLTPRQREVLTLIAQGKTRKQIAQNLGVSPKTVDTYRMQLMETLDIHEIAGLVRFAVKMGLVR